MDNIIMEKKVLSEEKIIDLLAEKKIDKDYYANAPENNFVIPRELTVTITLKEYRDLLKVKDTHDYEKDKINSEKWKVEQKVKELTAENEKLRNKLLESLHAKEERLYNRLFNENNLQNRDEEKTVQDENAE